MFWWDDIFQHLLSLLYFHVFCFPPGFAAAPGIASDITAVLLIILSSFFFGLHSSLMLGTCSSHRAKKFGDLMTYDIWPSNQKIIVVNRLFSKSSTLESTFEAQGIVLSRAGPCSDQGQCGVECSQCRGMPWPSVDAIGVRFCPWYWTKHEDFTS